MTTRPAKIKRIDHAGRAKKNVAATTPATMPTVAAGGRRITPKETTPTATAPSPAPHRLRLSGSIRGVLGVAAIGC